jgi:hypothetical protein
MIFLGPCLIPIIFAFVQCDNAHNSYQQGYDQGINDWNTFYDVPNHHFICLYNDTSAFCFGYDAALQFETSDQ